jgi:hypothetical protein
MRQMGKAASTAVFVGICLLIQTAFTVVQKSEPSESVLTLTKTVTAKMKYGERHNSSFDVQGRFIYTITEVRSDDSITGKVSDVVIGNLVYEISQEESLRVAKATGVPNNIIPSRIGQDDAHAFFEEGAICPKIGLKFIPMGSYLGELQFHFDWFTLDLDEKPDELSRLFCEWRRMSNDGKSTDTNLLHRINRILREEQKEKTK